MSLSETTKLAQALIRRPSVTPDDQGCQNLVAERLENAGFHNEPMRIEDVDNLWSIRGAEGPLFVFAGHTDVVPTGPESNWNHPPFSAEIENGHIHGRGAADMKGGVAAFITAIERFVEKYPDHPGSLGVLLTSDEEGPAKYGTKAVIDVLAERQKKIDWCIVGEPSSTKRLGDVIKVGRRGSLGGILSVKGKQGHIAYPHLADNAIHRALPLLNSLTEMQWDQGNDQFPPTAFQISNIEAGTGANNVIPGSLTVEFNLRFSPEITAKEIKARINTEIKRHQINATVEWNLSGLPFQTQHDSLVMAVEKAIFEFADEKPELSTSGGTSDGRFIAPTGAQVIELGPINATIHQVNERVAVQDLDQLTEIYEAILVSMLC